jgi:hypothetical protein
MDDTNEPGKCLMIRCLKHLDVGQQNTAEVTGAECGGCIAEERDRLRQLVSEVLVPTLETISETDRKAIAELSAMGLEVTRDNFADSFRMNDLALSAIAKAKELLG